jgi:hypothetical protein
MQQNPAKIRIKQHKKGEENETRRINLFSQNKDMNSYIFIDMFIMKLTVDHTLEKQMLINLIKR